MIHQERLSRYIMSKDNKKTTDRLIDFYDRLSVEQRKEIKDMFIKNKNYKYEI